MKTLIFSRTAKGRLSAAGGHPPSRPEPAAPRNRAAISNFPKTAKIAKFRWFSKIFGHSDPSFLFPVSFATLVIPVLFSLAFLFFPGSPLPASLKPTSLSGDRQHIVYFEGTASELEIYKIFGRETGPTVMILGGIQGDEPGGFMSADLYVDLALKKGNLIVVPRANFKSIISFARGVDGDMNRKFEAVKTSDPDRERVEIIKNLMAESDLFLNLHDGSGFFRNSWESDMANPNRYGQCIIADAEVYEHEGSGKVLHLGRDARRVVEDVNKEIREENYKFRFANHDTGSATSRHKEQRKSATYYALTRLGIPAFAIETSKDLPSLEMKILQHNLAINAFLNLYGVEIEHPRIHTEPPSLRFMVITVNGGAPLAAAEGETLFVARGDVVEVSYVGANYERGLSVDFQNLGSLNDLRTPLKIDSPTTIVARKDNQNIGSVKVALLKEGSGSIPRLERAGGGFLAG
ncbi:MAG: hypothetical protein LBF41_08080, partial [Deltaproteobacteria bacterium]|nr:hypothetical protein [Deltaproteobacteria bacterium]